MTAYRKTEPESRVDDPERLRSLGVEAPSPLSREVRRLCELRGVDSRSGPAAGLVHHFNNALMGILGASRMAARLLEMHDPARPYVDEITAEAERGLRFSRALLQELGGPDSAPDASGDRDPDPPPGANPGPDETGSPSPSHAESTAARVLVVEDERLIRITLRHELQALGYRVECAGDGHEAARLIADSADPFDVVLTDVVMPGPTGPEIAKLARARWPSARVIFMSAYPHDVLVQQGRIQPEQATLEKPFTEAQLVGKLREVLDSN